MDDLDAPRYAVINRAAISYGQTPVGMQRKHLEKMAENMNISMADLCKHIVTLNTEERFTFLREYYSSNNEEVSEFFSTFKSYSNPTKNVNIKCTSKRKKFRGNKKKKTYPTKMKLWKEVTLSSEEDVDNNSSVVNDNSNQINDVENFVVTEINLPEVYPTTVIAPGYEGISKFNHSNDILKVVDDSSSLNKVKRDFSFPGTDNTNSPKLITVEDDNLISNRFKDDINLPSAVENVIPTSNKVEDDITLSNRVEDDTSLSDTVIKGNTSLSNTVKDSSLSNTVITCIIPSSSLNVDYSSDTHLTRAKMQDDREMGNKSSIVEKRSDDLRPYSQSHTEENIVYSNNDQNDFTKVEETSVQQKIVNVPQIIHPKSQPQKCILSTLIFGESQADLRPRSKSPPSSGPSQVESTAELDNSSHSTNTERETSTSSKQKSVIEMLLFE